MKKKPYTTAELFDIVVEEMKKEGTLLDILDYDLATHKPEPITDYHFDIIGDLTFGGNEGIYLDMCLYGYIAKKTTARRVHIGTFKTLRTDRNALKYMGAMMADFIWTGRQFIDVNIEDFDF